MIKTIEEMEFFFDSYMPSLPKSGLRENRVSRMEILLKKLGNPEKSFSSYHIAGSKGKGTTASYLAKLIEIKRGKCGLYMSPHVYDIRERFTKATNFFSDKEYLDSINELESKIKDFSFSEELGCAKPTTFELYTAYAYLLFKNTGCKDAVIETGLGGRLDATNTLEPKAVIFTNIELEHTEILGNTFEEIAREKLGIMRKGVPTFCTQDRLFNLISSDYAAFNAPLFLFNEDKFNKLEYKRENNLCVYSLDDNSIILVPSSRIIHFDALYSFTIAKELGIVEKGEDLNLYDINLPARFEKVPFVAKDGKKLTMLLDGAHTPASCKEVLESLKDNIDKNTKPVLIFSAALGKKIDEIGKEIFPFFSNIVITNLGSFKKSNPEQIFEITKKIAPESNIKLIMDAKSVLEAAERSANENGYIVVLGSFYLTSRIKKALEEL